MNSNPIKIRPACSLDIPELQRLWKELIDDHKASNDFFSRSAHGHQFYANFISKQLTQKSAMIFVAEIPQSLVGYIHLEISDYHQVYVKNEFGFIHELVVTQAYRFQGIGKQLYNTAMQWFKKHKITRIELDVAASNPKAKQFWQALGFENFMNRLSKEI